jgi:hypothetical protein
MVACDAKMGEFVHCFDRKDMERMLNKLTEAGYIAFVYDKNRYIIRIYSAPKKGDMDKNGGNDDGIKGEWC